MSPVLWLHDRMETCSTAFNMGDDPWLSDRSGKMAPTGQAGVRPSTVATV